MTIDIKVLESNTNIDVKSNDTDKIEAAVVDNTQINVETSDVTQIDGALSVNSLDLNADIGEVLITSESINDYETLANRPKINGNVLSGNQSSNDLGLADKNHIHDDRYFTETEVNTLLDSKVDVQEGKVLSSNDFTDAEKAKLDGLSNYELPIASTSSLGGIMVGEGLAITNGILSATGGGEAESVQWDNVLNKPTAFTPSEHNHDERYYTETEIDNKLTNKADSNHNHDSRYYTETEVNTLLGSKVDTETGKGLSTNDYTNEEKEKLAFLTNYELPIASTTTLGGIKVGSGLSITNGILSASGGGEADSVQWDNVLNKPSTFTPSVHTHTKSEISDFPSLSSVATSGSYNDLTDTPTIPTGNIATQEWVEGKSYLTSETLDDYYTKTQTDSLIKYTSAWSGSCKSGSTITCTIPTTARSVVCRWYLNGYYSLLFIPIGLLSTTATKYIVSDDTEYGGGTLKLDGTTLTYTGTAQNNTSCYLSNIYYS